jgi:hypothetical protein
LIELVLFLLDIFRFCMIITLESEAEIFIFMPDKLLKIVDHKMMNALLKVH